MVDIGLHIFSVRGQVSLAPIVTENIIRKALSFLLLPKETLHQKSKIFRKYVFFGKKTAAFDRGLCYNLCRSPLRDDTTTY